MKAPAAPPEPVARLAQAGPAAPTTQGGAGADDEILRGHSGAVVGHSLGEVAATVVAGALSLEDGVRVICRHSQLCVGLAGAGAMASVELLARRVRAELVARGVTDVAVSVVASPQSTVIGEATPTVRELVVAGANAAA